MALVVLIESEDFDEYTEQEMRRWWRHRCKKHQVNGEVFFEVAYPVRFNTREGVKRLASFGVKARIVRRPTGGERR